MSEFEILKQILEKYDWDVEEELIPELLVMIREFGEKTKV